MYNPVRNKKKGDMYMIIHYLKSLFSANPIQDLNQPMDAEYEPYRKELRLAGLSEKKLRRMDPDARVAALEKARLDPYDYIYLAC